VTREDGGQQPSEGEDEWVGGLLARLPAHRALRVPPGHDCGAVSLGAGAGDGPLVVGTCDVLVDGVHFELARCGAAAAARKAVLVNLSDLAASASVPVAFWAGVVLPRGADHALFAALAEGFADVSREADVACAGGDTNVADGPLTISVTLLGRPGPMGVVTRAGAAPGDVLSVTGALGGSLDASLGGRHLSFTPRVREALALARHSVPHAMMDLSDGLSRDLPRLCRASGVGARVRRDDVPVHPDASRAGGDARSPLERALHDGEDFELLVAHAPLSEDTAAALRAEGVALHEIGRVVGPEEGIRLELPGRATAPLVAKGYDHLRQAARRT
jgi:thiamine-monophosphate kinase